MRGEDTGLYKLGRVPILFIHTIYGIAMRNCVDWCHIKDATYWHTIAPFGSGVAEGSHFGHPGLSECLPNAEW